MQLTIVFPIMAKFYCFPNSHVHVPHIEAKSGVPEFTTRDKEHCFVSSISCHACPGGVLGQVSDRDAPHRPSTRNATRVKKGGRNYTFCPILMKNRGRNTTFSSFLLKYRGQNTTFSSFLLKYRGRNSTNFPETWKRGVETEEHI